MGMVHVMRDEMKRQRVAMVRSDVVIGGWKVMMARRCMVMRWAVMVRQSEVKVKEICGQYCTLAPVLKSLKWAVDGV